MSNVAPFGSTVSYVWVALGLVAGVAVVYLLALLERRMSRAA
jgi:hypothetical protein